MLSGEESSVTQIWLEPSGQALQSPMSLHSLGCTQGPQQLPATLGIRPSAQAGGPESQATSVGLQLTSNTQRWPRHTADTSASPRAPQWLCSHVRSHSAISA